MIPDLDPHLIEADLGTARVGLNAICFPRLGSTNDTALDAASQEGADGLVVVADCQSAGRGRQGRRWLAQPGEAILASVLLIDEQPPRLAASAVTIAAGLATAEAIARLTDLEPDVKWPNDVMLSGRKVCGVLVEARPLARGRAMVVGMGINVLGCPPADRTDLPATSLAEALAPARPPTRLDLLRAVLRRLDWWIGQIAAGRTDELACAWRARCGLLGRRIVAHSDGRVCEGTLVDVAPLEGLVLACDDGRRILLRAETTSLRAVSP